MKNYLTLQQTNMYETVEITFRVKNPELYFASNAL